MQQYIFAALIFICGLVIGSFLNVCIYRIPQKKSIAYPPSACPNCAHRLSGLDLVPVLSYVSLGGKCRYCKVKISPRYPLVELLTAVLYLLAFYIFGVSLSLIPVLFLTTILIIASFIDLDYLIIPDGLLLIGGAMGIIFLIYPGEITLLNAILGAICGAGVILAANLLSLALFKKDGMGGGDLKLMAMAGLYLGWKLCLFAVLSAIWACAIVIIISLAFKKIDKAGEIPFGPFLSAGCLFSLLFGERIISAYFALFL